MNKALSERINEYIRQHAANAFNWQTLTDAVNREFKTNLTVAGVRNRGLRYRVTTQGRRFGESSESSVKKDALTQQLVNILKKRRQLRTIEQIADALDVSPARVRQAAKELKQLGHNVHIADDAMELSKEIPKGAPLRIDIRRLEGRVIRFGVTADNHLGSKYERLDVLNALFDLWKKEGIDTVYQLGNIIDGESRVNRYDLHVHGMEGQAKYLAKQWPKREGMKTYFLTGDDHEGWYVQREGIVIGQYLEDTARKEGRDDLIYLGHMEHDIVFRGEKKDTVLRLIHAGGGSAYATSYSVQKIVESYQSGEKPHVLLVGHYHKAEYGYPREVHVIQGGCTCDQTPFMRKHKLQAHVGGWTVEMTINREGAITRFRQEWIPFFDLGYYEQAWKYRGTRLAA
jgi:DNA-binding Lrp family transcriptional regulator